MKIYQWILVSLPLLAACDTYSYKTALPTKEQMGINTRVYGDVDGPARQSKNPNTNTPDAAQKSALLRAQLYENMRYSQPKHGKAAKAPVDTAKAMSAQQE